MYRDPFQEIRERISAPEAARFYGLAITRSGTALCPWHSDRHPSLKLYEGDRGCWCFACQHGGDVVELVSGILGVSRVQAAQQINKDFALGLTFGQDRETPEERRNREARRAELERYKSFLRWLDEALIMLCAVHRLGWEARSIPPEDLTEAEALAVRELPRVAWWLDALGSGNMMEIRPIFEQREEVEALCNQALKISEPQSKTA